MKKKRRKIGLALGSGGAKGYAHLGVLKVLERNEVPIDYISGASAGAIVGALYSLYKNTEKVEEILTDFNKIKSLVDISFKGGVFKGKKIINFLDDIFLDKEIQDLDIPLCVVATDYRTGEEVRIKKGNVALAVRASMAIPFMFELVDYNKKELADGGLSSPVPINALKDMGADITIGVRIEDKMGQERKNIYAMAERSVAILQHNLSNWELKNCDVLIDPYFEDYGILGFHKIFQGKVRETIEEGERAAESNMSEIRNIMRTRKDIPGIYKL
ncbi:MAG: patatin-like phospholipase family protein [Candidatus Pacebacteria bacterium]|nr:patatin-like phospholipase family protein [Candidatus Paceibacterota bacterium]